MLSGKSERKYILIWLSTKMRKGLCRGFVFYRLLNLPTGRFPGLFSRIVFEVAGMSKSPASTNFMALLLAWQGLFFSHPSNFTQSTNFVALSGTVNAY
jgi:hypothetical protein